MVDDLIKSSQSPSQQISTKWNLPIAWTKIRHFETMRIGRLISQENGRGSPMFEWQDVNVLYINCISTLVYRQTYIYSNMSHNIYNNYIYTYIYTIYIYNTNMKQWISILSTVWSGTLLSQSDFWCLLESLRMAAGSLAAAGKFLGWHPLWSKIWDRNFSIWPNKNCFSMTIN